MNEVDMRVSIIGAGNVGSLTCARIVEAGLADVILVDTIKGLAQGRARDINDASACLNSDCKAVGVDDYSLIKDSKIIIITAGYPRKPGMKRKDLIENNLRVMKEVMLNIKKYITQECVIIVVTNPLDIMTYICYKLSGFDKSKVIGMAGVLDSTRFNACLAEDLNLSYSQINSMVIGPHSSSMLILPKYSNISGIPIQELLSEAKIGELSQKSSNQGTFIVDLLKGQSASFAPSCGIYKIVEAILKDKTKILPTSCYLQGEYGLEDICIGVPAKIGKDGIKEIIELKLSDEEREKLLQGAKEIKQTIKIYTKQARPKMCNSKDK